MKEVFIPKKSVGKNKFKFSDASFVSVESRRNKIDAVVNFFIVDLAKNGISKHQFEEFLKIKLKENNQVSKKISGFSVVKNILFIHNIDSSDISIKLKDFEEFRLKEVLKEEKIKDIESRVSEIHRAIHSIYYDNDGYIFDGEIDNDDVVGNGEYKGKTLQELRELLDIETGKLHNAYLITGESHKQEELLHREIDFFAGIGDLYEGGARYFSLSDDDIQRKVGLLISDMSLHEIFQTIISYNTKINDNWRKSDMVTQVNAKLMTAFYQQALDRIFTENASNQDIFHFVRIITGREKTVKTYYERGETSQYNESISFDNSMANYEIASRALIFAMHRPSGVFEEIQKTKEEFQFGDPEIENKVPRDIISKSIGALDKINTDEENFGVGVLKIAGFGDLINTPKSYQELSFDEKIQLGAIFRIAKYIEKLPPEKLKDKNLLRNYILKTSDEAFEVLKNDLDDEFDGVTIPLLIASPNIGGYSSEDLSLTGDFAVIFDLYQDIQGNSGLFDLHDANEDWFQSPGNIATLGVGIIAGIILLPLGAASVGAMALAGAGMGLATGITGLITSRKGYDTYSEAALDSTIQLTYEIVSSAAFMMAFGQILKRVGAIDEVLDDAGNIVSSKLRVTPDMLFSRNAWQAAGIGDKFIIFAEVITGMLGNGAITGFIRQQFPENYFNTDTTNFSKEISKNK